ncbi:GATA transcription factor 11-like [Trifolium medium]|uniref:GATA transcription factor 11-like n=1 Tax=Trifolium medium TaxID=97028 RepID=A0A392QDU1_9FABA|nr:GATA transcription factor 11-like [Trifolium medium]
MLRQRDPHHKNQLSLENAHTARSGRLYPEYRPANSPTYVESVHSNCHKKVLEMRGVVVKEGVRGRSTSMLASSNLSGNSVGQQRSHGSY